jgi:hypothetical protein
MSVELLQVRRVGPSEVVGVRPLRISRTITREKKHANWRPVEGNVFHECAVCTTCFR